MAPAHRWRTVAWRALFMCLLLLVGRVAAAAEASPEYRVKAAFVFKFGEYVEWPTGAFAQADSPFLIGVLGADPLAEELARFATGRTIGGRTVEVRRLERGASRDGLHMLFIGRGAEADRAAEIGALRGAVLTITEAGEDTAAGSAINFVLVAGKVRFDVSLPVAEDAGLRISSRLLGVARKVETGR